MSKNKVKKQDWDDPGHNEYLDNSIAPKDENYLTDYDIAYNLQDGAIAEAKVANISANKVTTGTLSSTDGNTRFDLENRYIIINDGTNDRVLLGYDEDGF